MFKKIKGVLLAALFVLCMGFAVNSHAQTVTLPPATAPTPYVVDLSWTASTSCNTTTALCVYTVYRLPGTCPSGTLAGTTGWTLVGTTAVSTVTYVDTTVSPSTQYSYVVEAVLQSDSANSNPSNCVTLSVPATPVVPQAVTITGTTSN